MAKVIDELTQQQICKLWRDGHISAKDAIESMKREVGWDILMMHLISESLLGKATP